MYTEGFEQWFKANKNMSAPLAEMGKATTDICRRCAQQNMEMMSENYSRLTDQMKRLSSVRKPEDFFNLQREIINEDITAAMENLQKWTHNALENYEELSRLWSTTAAKVTETAVDKAQKYTEKSER